MKQMIIYKKDSTLNAAFLSTKTLVLQIAFKEHSPHYD